MFKKLSGLFLVIYQNPPKEIAKKTFVNRNEYMEIPNSIQKIEVQSMLARPATDPNILAIFICFLPKNMSLTKLNSIMRPDKSRMLINVSLMLLENKQTNGIKT